MARRRRGRGRRRVGRSRRRRTMSRRRSRGVKPLRLGRRM